MANNLRVFNTNSEYQSADLVHPAVSYVIETDKVHYEPTTPVFQGKWKATYSNGNVTSAECGSSSEIAYGEINKTDLISVEVGNCVTSLGNGAFQNCRSLTSVIIPDAVTSIGNGAFLLCDSLTSITIPDSVTSIGDSAFDSCRSLTSIDIPSGVTFIGDTTFQECTSLTSIEIPSGVTFIDNAAFQYCTSLTSIIVKATTPPTLGSDAFYRTNNCPIYVPCESVEAYKSASGWSDYASRITCIQPSFKWKVTFSNDTTSSGACSSNTELTSSELPLDRFVKLEVGDCCTIVGANLSGRLSGVTSATISDSVTKIGIRMFYQCSKLKTVEVGSGVTRIDDWFVNGCNVLTSVTIKTTTPPTLGTACFTNSNNCPIYVPSASVNAYKTASGWNMYASRIL